MQLVEILLTPLVLGVAAGIVALMYAIGQVPVGEKRLRQKVIWRKLAPIIPLVLGIVGVFMPGVVEDSPGWGHTLLVGLWAGFVASHGRKIAKRLLVDKLKEG